MRTAAKRDRHLQVSADKVRVALKANPADLVVLPELSSIDYSRTAFDNLETLAEPLDGASFVTWSDVARSHGCHVSYGFARRAEDGLFITIAVVGPDGALVGHYDKLHLAQYGASMEKEYFTRGDHLFTFELCGFRTAPIICYDIRIPELCRTLVIDHGVDLILHCGAYYRDESFATWHPFAVTRAMENQVYFLSLNRAGRNYGNSIFCLPWMDETTPSEQFEAQAEDLRFVTLSKNELRTTRRDYTFLGDRLPDYDLPGP